MQGGDDTDGEQQRKREHVEQVVVYLVAHVLEHLGQSSDRHVRAVEICRSVVNHVLDVLQQFREVVEIGPVQIMIQSDHDGGRVPDPVTVQIVGGVTVHVAVEGWIKVVGVPDHGGERTPGLSTSASMRS